MGEAFHYESRKKKSIIVHKELENALRDLKHHLPPLDLHAFYRLHLKSLLVGIFHVI